MSDSSKPSKPVGIVPKGAFVPIIVIVIIGLGIIGAICFNRPVPELNITKTMQNITLPGEFSVTFPDQGASAVGMDSLGVIAASSDQSSIPIASVAKIMTAYLVLQAHPLQPGQEGPTLTMTAEDVAGYKFAVENNYSLLPVALGEKLTERQLLQGLMLPSANNIADTLGRWVAGTNEAFVAKMNETAAAFGMDKTHYADASGANPATVSNAVDQIKIAQAAMKDPVFREIVATQQAVLPVAGKVYNVNAMLGKHGVVGIKTGSSVKAGGCFVSATPITDGGDKHYIIAVVLGSKKANQNLKNAFETNVQILDQVRPQFKAYTLTPPASGFGKINTPWHTQSDLAVNEPIQIFGYPGMKLDYSITPQTTRLPTAQGSDAATLTIKKGDMSKTVTMRNTAPINPPGFLWRLLRY